MLGNPNNVEKSIQGICKSGKKMSNENKKTLKGIYDSLSAFLSKFQDEEEEEETEMTKSEIQEIVKSAVSEYLQLDRQIRNQRKKVLSQKRMFSR